MRADRATDIPSRRAKAYRSVPSLQRDIRACSSCLNAGYFVEPRPVFEGHAGQRAMIIGQAPGEHEGVQGRPWRGRAGRSLRRWLELTEHDFYAMFYCTSVTRCYPGKSPSGRGDRTPTTAEIQLCEHWRSWELKLVRPRIVIPVGGLALRGVLGKASLSECIGQRFSSGETVVVPLPHPSGASGWLNDPRNRQRLQRALAILHCELDRAGIRSGERAEHA